MFHQSTHTQSHVEITSITNLLLTTFCSYETQMVVEMHICASCFQVGLRFHVPHRFASIQCEV